MQNEPKTYTPFSGQIDFLKKNCKTIKVNAAKIKRIDANWNAGKICKLYFTNPHNDPQMRQSELIAVMTLKFICCTQQIEHDSTIKNKCHHE